MNLSDPPSAREHAPAAERLATLLHLTRRAREAPSLQALGFIAANESRELLPYRQAALARDSRVHAALPAEVLAVSGLPQPDPQAPYVQWLAQVFRHLSARPADAAAAAGPSGESDVPTALHPADLPELLARDWCTWLPAHVLIVPVRRPDGARLGTLLLAREAPWHDADRALAGELGDAYGHAWAGWQPRAGWGARLRAWSASRTRRWAAAVAVLAVALCPVRLTVLVPAEVTPIDPFLVRAPLDGVIDRFHVKPNQSVAAGQPLFDLDTTALRTRESVARKAYDVATEEYRQAAQLAVTDEKGKLDMALKKGRLEERAVDLAYSQELLKRVQVKAARAGVAVFADVNDWQGRAVAVGERVLTLADPAKVELSLALPVGDVIRLESGAAATFYPNGSAFTDFDARLTSAAYRAEVMPDGILAYRLKAAFVGSESLPRVGLMGTAKLRGEWVPLGYYVLRRPLAVARQWLGW